MQNSRLRYDKLGPAAILLSAYGADYAAPAVAADPVDQDGIACVEVCGPLTQHAGFGFDSYDAVLSRVRAALATPATSVVMKIGSPGGDVFGCFETARAIRAAADASGKTLVAYVDGLAASAAYALACAADKIITPAAGSVGSVGCIDMLASVVRQDAAMGVDVAVITSGARKADGNPHVPLSEGALAAHQAHVDELAGIFFAWVAERRGLSVEAVKGFEAALFIGQNALEAGLVDQVQDFHELRGTLTATARNVPMGPRGNRTMSTPKASKYTDAMAALAALAEDGDEDAKKAMKKMLSPAKAESDDKDGEKKPDAKAESGDDKKDADKDAAGAKAATAVALDALTEVGKLRTELAELAERDERRSLLASRADLSADPKMSAWLATAPIETVRQAVTTIPKATLTPPAPVDPTRGASDPVGLPADQAKELRIEMGLESHPRASVTRAPNMIVFGGTPAQIAERLGEGK